MWLKGLLIGRGYTVWLPELPNSNKPNTKTYNKFLLANPRFAFDENTVLIGHSSGAVEILSLLQHLPVGTTIKAAILVSAFKDNLKIPALNGLFAEPFDFELIKQHCPNITFVHSDNDSLSPLKGAQYLADKTGGNLITIEGQGHFHADQENQYKQFPEIIEVIDGILQFH